MTDGITLKYAASGACTYYDNDLGSNAPYGKFYNGYADHDTRQLCLVGWHVATEDDWKVLELYLGMPQKESYRTGQRGTNQGGNLKWKRSDSGMHPRWSGQQAGATNEVGFPGLPGGHRKRTAFIDLGYYWFGVLSLPTDQIFHGWTYMTLGFSVRCIKNE